MKLLTALALFVSVFAVVSAHWTSIFDTWTSFFNPTIEIGLEPVEWKSAFEIDKENGPWIILIKYILKQQPVDNEEETIKTIITIITEHQDEITEAVTTGDFEIVIKILTEQCKPHGITIDWDKVFSEEDTTSFWKLIITKWASTKTDKVDMDIDDWMKLIIELTQTPGKHVTPAPITTTRGTKKPTRTPSRGTRKPTPVRPTAPWGHGDPTYSAGGDISVNTRIVGGRQAMKHEIPYQVVFRFRNPNQQWCGGVIVGKHWILTAAHCTVQGDENPRKENLLDPRNLWAIIGGVDQRTARPPFSLNVKNIYVHPEAHVNPVYNDVGLVETYESLIIDGYTQAVTLPELDQDFYGKTAKASGYGAVKFEGAYEDLSDTEKTVDLKILSPEECKAKNPRYRKDMELCAVSTEDENVCYGDSGGPLAIHEGKNKFILVGTVSHGTMGTTCGTADNPSYFAKVSHYIPWIKKVMSGRAQ